MQRYLMLAKFDRKGNANVQSIGERFASLQRNYEWSGGRTPKAFGAVGDYFGVISFEAPDLVVRKRDYRTMIEEL